MPRGHSIGITNQTSSSGRANNTATIDLLTRDARSIFEIVPAIAFSTRTRVAFLAPDNPLMAGYAFVI